MTTTTYGPGRGSRFDVEDVAPEQARHWWLFLVTGSLWLLFALLVFRFNIKSVTGVGIAVGAVCIAAGINEFLSVSAARGGWKVARAALGVLFCVVGLVALAYPNRTFVEVAAIFSIFLLLKGGFDMITAFMPRRDFDLWWTVLIVGAVEILLAFWAAGNFGRESVLLIVWVGAAALARGVTELVFAIRLREIARTRGPGPAVPA